MLRKLLRKIGIGRVTGQDYPDFWVIPSHEGQGVSMDFWIIALGENKEVPNPGDLVIHLHTDGMGASVRRDTRWRVSRQLDGEHKSVEAYNEDGHPATLHVFYMRRHRTLRRVWFLLD